MPSPKNSFAVLGCDPWVTKDELRDAYIALVKQLHPDTHPNDRRAEERLKEVILAYDYIMANFDNIPRPKRKPRPQKTEWKTTKPPRWDGAVIFRVLEDKKALHSFVVPLDATEQDLMVHCMWRGVEFRFKLPKGTRLPITIRVRDIGCIIEIAPHPFVMWGEKRGEDYDPWRGSVEHPV